MSRMSRTRRTRHTPRRLRRPPRLTASATTDRHDMPAAARGARAKTDENARVGRPRAAASDAPAPKRAKTADAPTDATPAAAIETADTVTDDAAETGTDAADASAAASTAARAAEPLATWDGADGYFDQHASRAVISTAPISLLPSLTRTEYGELVEQTRGFYGPARAAVMDTFRGQFGQWLFEMGEGYNIVLYGVGSKRAVLEEFAEYVLETTVGAGATDDGADDEPDGEMLVVNGYNPGLSVLEVLFSVCGFLFPGQKLPRTLPDLLRLVGTAGSSAHLHRLVVVLHSMDGPALRSDKAQTAVAALARQVRVVASVDNINGPLLWDAARLSALRFLWHETATFAPYDAETAFTDPLEVVEGLGAGTRGGAGAPAGETVLQGMRFVLESLTANARGVYRVLVSQQLDAVADGDDTPERAGLEFHTLYARCSEEFLVGSELSLRTVLTEFYEHGMAASTRARVGSEIVYVPFGRAVLESVLVQGLVD
ncbi:origin recognition complex subunit 2-domain-containing protein [Dipodascopsis tothii]|uniref:origin recognition complex subunit 2-domain-containing protein n=1 Tax=Dipodascopsis tothii TaxID=44089 RepID=UPI0034CEB4C2